MVKDGSVPTVGGVTGFAGIAGGQMIEGLAFGMQPVMASEAGSLRLGMVELGNGPGRYRMAVGAIVAGANMGFRLAGCDIAVVAGETSRNKRSMVDTNGGPFDGAVTLAAGVGGLGMIRRFALCQAAVVAFLADLGHSLEDGACVARFARGGQMGAIKQESGLFVMIETAVDLERTVDLLGGCLGA